MLADVPPSNVSSGSLAPTIQQPAEFVVRLLDRIADHLPEWRDDLVRPSTESETELTSQLCEYLNSATRKLPGWDGLQFRTEVRDEASKGRTVDLTVKPCGMTLSIEGRVHTHYDMILPIECKRLPTPNGRCMPVNKERDEREYVHSSTSTTGGIQRFKLRHHGASHSRGAMIGYVQSGTIQEWLARVNQWIADLCQAEEQWEAQDQLTVARDEAPKKLCTLLSSHSRGQGHAAICLHHLWVGMN